MGTIVRSPASAAAETYDLIIVGGGIYGAMLSLEASRRGLRSLTLERDDFGSATSFNNLRIIHGGLRYLQNLDLRRFQESVGERYWFLRTFPSLARPLPCLMPLYGNGLRSKPVFRIALGLNDFLSGNRATSLDRHLPSGRVIDADRTREIFPSVDPQRLKGGAVWYDGFMPDSPRLLIEVLRWSCGYGATALNYVEARELMKTGNRVAGVSALDRESGAYLEFRSGTVVNACGPWSRGLATRFDRDKPHLFRSSLAWNVLLDRTPPSDHALAVSPPKPGGRTYFLVPWKGKLLAGTGHAPWHGPAENPQPSQEQLRHFLDDLNLAVPSLELTRDQVLYVLSGLLPATEEGRDVLADREVFVDHSVNEGPRGLYSVSGVKFTTARLVAEKTLNRIFPEAKAAKDEPAFAPSSEALDGSRIIEADAYPSVQEREWKELLRSHVHEESVLHLDDLIFRRTALWSNPERTSRILPFLLELFPWDKRRCDYEEARWRNQHNQTISFQKDEKKS